MGRTFAGPGTGILFTIDVLPGDTSAVLIIKTNTTAYGDNGGAEFFDNNDTHTVVANFEPVVSPEPSAGILVGIGLAGLTLFRKSLSPPGRACQRGDGGVARDYRERLD